MNSEIIDGGSILKYHIDLPSEHINPEEQNHTVVCTARIIGKEAFSYSNVQIFNCRKKLIRIEEQAFAYCENLKYFLMRCTLPKENEFFNIEKEAFLNCSELRTVELSGGDKIIIKKDAFKGCISLRTVKIECETIILCENPFEECPEYLTFICHKNSKIERFAIEHGYRVIYE